MFARVNRLFAQAETTQLPSTSGDPKQATSSTTKPNLVIPQSECIHCNIICNEYAAQNIIFYSASAVAIQNNLQQVCRT